MKLKNLKSTLLILIILSFTTQSAFASDNKISIGMHITHTQFQDDSVNLFNTDFDTEFDSTTGLMVDFIYSFTKAFSLGLGIGYLKTDMEVSEGIFTGGYAELQQIPLQLTALYRFDLNKVAPYIGAGIGYYLNSMDRNDSDEAFFDGAPDGVKAVADDAFGYHVALGLDYLITEKIAMNLDLKYVWSKTDIGFKGAGYDDIHSTKLNAFSPSIGIKYLF